MNQLSQIKTNPPENLAEALELCTEDCLESLWGFFWADSFDEYAIKTALKKALLPIMQNAIPVSVPRPDLKERDE